MVLFASPLANKRNIASPKANEITVVMPKTKNLFRINYCLVNPVGQDGFLPLTRLVNVSLVQTIEP